MYMSYYDKVYQLLWWRFHLFAWFVTLPKSSLFSNPFEVTYQANSTVLCIPNNQKLTGLHVGLGLNIAGVEIFSSDSETTDWSFHVSVILQKIGSAWWQPVLLINECLVSMIMSWIAEEQLSESSSVNDILFFNSEKEVLNLRKKEVLRKKKEALKFD